MTLKFATDVTVQLRYKDVDLLLKALQQFMPTIPEEADVRRHLLDVFGYLAMPEDTRQ